MRVTVLLGGASDERDVSFATGVQVAGALREAGHQVALFDTADGPVSPEREAEIRERGVPAAPPSARLQDRLVTEGMRVLGAHREAARADVFFIALHGGAGEDGHLQTVLDLAGVRYTGSGPLACRAAMNKAVTKELLRGEGIPTPPWLMDVFDADDIEETLGLPVVLKAVSGGSSLRLERAGTREELEAALTRAREFDDAVLVEAMVPGREFTVAVLDDEALPVGEIIPRDGFFDYEAKYQPGMAREIFPAELEAGPSAELQRLALEVHRTLGLRDYSRVDFMMDKEGGFHVLEANNLPGLTAQSLVPRAAAAAGISFPELCDRIVRMAAERGRGT